MYSNQISVNGKPQPATTQMWWAGISRMCYVPGTVAPIGLAPEGLPIGVQIIGPQFGDLTTIRVAQLIEREYYAFVPPPDCAWRRDRRPGRASAHAAGFSSLRRAPRAVEAVSKTVFIFSLFSGRRSDVVAPARSPKGGTGLERVPE